MSYVPTPGARELARRLQNLRDERGLTQEDVAAKLGVDRTTIGRFENLRRAPTMRLIRQLLDLYEIAGQERTYLEGLWRGARAAGWLREFRHLPPGYLDHIAQEAEATSIDIYEGEVVPGLLQTEGYARRLVDQSPVTLTVEQIEQRITSRKRRQEFVMARPTRLTVVLDESVLLRQIGGREIMRPQLERIMQIADLQAATIQIVPLDSGSLPPPTPINILRFGPDDPVSVVIEVAFGDWLLEAPEHREHHIQIFDRLRSQAESRGASRRRIAEILERYQ